VGLPGSAAEIMVVMGRVVGPFAVKGWIKVQPFTQLPGGLLDYPVWWLGREDGWTPRWLEDGAVHGKSVVAKLERCDEREAAAAMTGLEVAVPRSQLPQSAEGEYYWTDLVGLEVRNLQRQVLGRIVRLLETGANQVLVVTGDRERLIPFVSAVVVTVDLAQGEMVVDWGLDF
jgi:16S rRNA processing protein RimM